MEYREIVAVTGIGGLFQLITTKSDGAIVRSLADKSTKFIPARVHNVTPIESIEIYTTGENVRLHEVLQAMDKSSIERVDVKKADNNSIKAYFQQVFPSFDEDRVYVSDMKKIVKWYEILKANDLLHFEMYNQVSEGQEANVTAEDAEEKPAKKAKTIKDVAESEATEVPAKKARTKKAKVETAEGEEAPAKKTARKKKTEE